MREGQGMGDKTEFPHRLFEAYAEKRITRSEFMVRFSAWQKAHGIDYGCRGTADKAGTYVTYRGGGEGDLTGRPSHVVCGSEARRETLQTARHTERGRHLRVPAQGGFRTPPRVPVERR